MVKLLAIDLRHFFTNVETKKLCNGLSNQWEDLAQKKVLPSLKQSSTNQPLLVRGPAESHDRSAFFTHFFGACLSLSSLSVGSALVVVVGVKFLTLLNEFPRKGGRQTAERTDRKGVKFKHVFNFQFLLHPLLTLPLSLSLSLSQMYRGKKAGKRGETTTTIPRIIRISKKAGKSASFFLLLLLLLRVLRQRDSHSCPFKPQ